MEYGSLDYVAFLNTVATLFVLMIVGFYAGKIGLIDNLSSKKLSSIIIGISQPVLIISSLISIEYSKDFLVLGLKTLAFGFIAHIAIGIFAFFACAKFKDLDERKIIEFSMIFGNTGFIGIPILRSLLGSTGAFMASFIMPVFNILLWTLGMAILARKRKDIKLTIRKALINKGTVPSLIGFIIFIIPAFWPGFKLPGFATESLSYLSSLCTPVSMLIIGALLAKRTPKQIFGSWKIYYLSAFKLIVTPLLVCIVMKLLGFSELWIVFGTTIVAMPAGSSASMFGEVYDIAPGFAAQSVGTTTLLAIGTMPLVVWIAQTVAKLQIPTLLSLFQK